MDYIPLSDAHIKPPLTVERPDRRGEVDRRMTAGSPVRGPLVLLAGPAEVLRLGGEHLLTAEERQRAAALRHPADREAHAAAHLLVRHCAAAVTGRPVGVLRLEQRCAECGSTAHGRPSIAGLPGVHVSLAHTRGAVVAGADRQPIGVDVERARPGGPDPAVLDYTLTVAERARVRSAEDPSAAFLRHWVRKECLVKAGAVALDRLPEVELDPRTERPAGGGRMRGRSGPLHLVDWFDPALDVAVAAAGHEPPVVGSLRRATPSSGT
jgi:4'-phosphopantetheinyl transferase